MALEKWKHSLYGNEWTCLCFNKTFCRDTEIWISYGFYVSWNATFLLIFFQTFTNINTILGSWAVQKTGDKPDLAQRMLFANLSSSLPSLMCYTMGFTFYILVDHCPGSIRMLKIINAFPALLLPFPSLWPPTPCSTAPLSLSVPDSPNGKKNYPFTVRKSAFWREKSGFQAVSPGIQTSTKKECFFYGAFCSFDFKYLLPQQSGNTSESAGYLMLSYLTLHSPLHVGYTSKIASYVREDKKADLENYRRRQLSPGRDCKESSSALKLLALSLRCD